MNTKLIVLLCCVAVAVADSRPRYGYQSPEEESSESYEPESYEDAKYDFDWSVKDGYSGNDFGQVETRDGDHTQGSYFVHLPDGRLQKVTYYVDGDSGFVADVSYEGDAKYPSSEESVEAYAPPRPRYGN